MFDGDIKRLEEEIAKEKDPETRERLQSLLDTRKAEREAVVNKVKGVIKQKDKELSEALGNPMIGILILFAIIVIFLMLEAMGIIQL